MDGVLFFFIFCFGDQMPYTFLTLDVFPWLCDVRLRPRWFLMMSRARVGAKMKWEINWWWHHSDAPAVWVSALSQRRNRIAPHRTNPLPRRDKSSAPASQSSPPLIHPSDTLPPLIRGSSWHWPVNNIDLQINPDEQRGRGIERIKVSKSFLNHDVTEMVYNVHCSAHVCVETNRLVFKCIMAWRLVVRWELIEMAIKYLWKLKRNSNNEDIIAPSLVHRHHW